jgi:hypothetical protein
MKLWTVAPRVVAPTRMFRFWSPTRTDHHPVIVDKRCEIMIIAGTSAVLIVTIVTVQGVTVALATVIPAVVLATVATLVIVVIVFQSWW